MSSSVAGSATPSASVPERRIAFVAAGSRGLGRASAQALAEDGCDVAICARTAVDVERTARDIASATGRDLLALVGDVGSLDDIRSMIAKTVAHFGALHIVVANGGGPSPGTFDALTEAQWTQAIEGTLLSTVRLFREALPHLRSAQWGRLLVITSSSVREPIDGLLLSNVTRPAIAGLCKTLSKELGAEGITVNNVAPGSFATDRITHVHQRIATVEGISMEQARARAEAQIPSRRLGDPMELGRVVAFLASPAASYVNGQTLLVDGGKSASL